MEMTREQVEKMVAVQVLQREGTAASILAHDQAQREKLARYEQWFEAVAQSGVVDVNVQTADEFIAWAQAQAAALLHANEALSAQAAALADVTKAAEHWNKQYRDCAQQKQDAAARYGQQIVDLEQQLADVTKERDEAKALLTEAQASINWWMKAKDEVEQSAQATIEKRDEEIASLTASCHSFDLQINDAQATIQRLTEEREALEVIAKRRDKDFTDMQALAGETEFNLRRMVLEYKRARDLQKEVADNQTWHVRALTQRLVTVEGERDKLKETYAETLHQWEQTMAELAREPHECHEQALTPIVTPDSNNTLDVNNALQQRITTLEGALKDLCDAIPEETLNADPPLKVWWQQAETALAPAPGGHIVDANKMVCVWSQDGGNSFSTACGNHFMLGEDNERPTDFMKFCCYCGKPVEDVMENDDTGAQPGGEG